MQGRTQKFIEGGARMAFCIFYGTVAVKTFIFKINILSAKLGDEHFTVTSIIVALTFKIVLRELRDNDFLQTLAENVV